tara:strand:+ start:2111 stop:2872 length:762 start_codon:yes stop_codon:yes gene_type:complete
MKKIKTLGIWKEVNDNYQSYSPVEDASSPEDMIHWGEAQLKYDLEATTSYSQSFQDIFVASVMGEKKRGTYLELGCSYPVEINNTYLLESEYDWTGVSIDIDPKRTKVFEQSRKNTVVTLDAGLVDYDDLLSQYDDNHVDYLQFDVDDNPVTLKVLKDIDFSKYDFSVITFEHNTYADGMSPDFPRGSCNALKDYFKSIMDKHGYVLVAEDVCNMTYDDPFEDWYINPKYVDEENWKRFESKSERAMNIMFEV